MLCHGRGPQPSVLSIPGSIPQCQEAQQGDSVTRRPIKGRKRSRQAHRPLFSLACSLVGQIEGVYEGGRHVRDLLAAEREVIERIALDGESVPVSLQVMEIEILREDQLPNEL